MALTTEDRLAIEEVLHRYCHCIDRGLWDEFPTLFTDDAKLDFGQTMGVHEGRAGVAAFGEMLKNLGLFMRHYNTNFVIRGGSANAHVHSYVLALTGSPGNVTPTTGFYEDELVKVGGRWLLHSRRASIER